MKTLIEALVDLEHLASVLNSRQHAGLKITPVMWGELYDRCAEAKAVVGSIEREARAGPCAAGVSGDATPGP